MITCKEAENLILLEEKGKDLQEHLAECPVCAKYLRDYKRIKDFSFSSHQENNSSVPSSVDFAILSEAQQYMNRNKKQAKKRFFFLLTSSAAVILFAAVFSFLFMTGNSVDNTDVPRISVQEHHVNSTEDTYSANVQFLSEVESFSLDFDYSSHYDTLCFNESMLNQLNHDVESL